MNNITKLLSIVLFLLISMFYTNKSIEILKENDPLMKEIKSTQEKYKIDALDAVINGDEMTSGSYGVEIDYLKTYNNMKKYGTYNESLTVLKDTKPTISIDDSYDKYLVKGNNKNRNIALVFTINDQSKDIESLLKLLDEKDVQATFFIDGTVLEDNIYLVKQMKGHEVEILSYKDNYDNVLLKTSRSYLESITGKEAKFCYAKYSNDELLKICQKEHLHTIKPKLIIENNIYQTLKKNIEPGIAIDIDKYQLSDLDYALNYIKSKGYNTVTVKDLFAEN